MAIKRRSEAIWIESKAYWQVKVQKDGVRKAFTSALKGRKGKHEAEAKADEWLEKGTVDMRFPAAWELFLEYTKANTGTGNYKNHEKWGRLYLQPELSSKKLSTISYMDWQRCINDMVSQKELSARTCKNVIGTITAFISYCDGENWGVKPLKKKLIIPNAATPVREKRIMQPDAIKVLFNNDTVHYYGKPIKAFYIYAWRFLVATGLRRGELCGLRNEDVQGFLSVKRSINSLNEETRGKNDNARRTMRLTSIASEILAEQKIMLERNGIESPWVFPDEDGDRSDPNHVYKMWSRYSKEHNINCTLHEMRHTFISINRIDMPIELLKGIVGHSVSMDTIGVYGHEIDGEKELAAQYIDSAFSRILGGENKSGWKSGWKKN